MPSDPASRDTLIDKAIEINTKLAKGGRTPKVAEEKKLPSGRFHGGARHFFFFLPFPLPLALPLPLAAFFASFSSRSLCEYTRARCYSPLTFLVTIGILHIKDIGEGQ
jgi:hypothetical protein